MEFKAEITRSTFKDKDGKDLIYYPICVFINGEKISLLVRKEDKKMYNYLCRNIIK